MFTDNQFDEYVCRYCGRVYDNPYQSSDGCRYCFRCLESIILEKRKCFCGSDLDPNFKIKDKGFEKDLMKINLKCTKCDWNGSLKNYEKHFKETHEIIEKTCPFEDIGCINFNYLNESLDAHLGNNFKNHSKFLKDSYDKLKQSIAIKNNEGNSQHENEIIKQLNDLQNKTNLIDFLKSDLNQSITNQEILMRQFSEMEEKLRIANEKNLNLEKNLILSQSLIISLENDVFNLRNATYNGMFIWKITHVREKIQEAISGRQVSCYSTPFYSSQYGYKMCARIYLNGDGIGKNTHVSLFFVIMRGEYDGLLKWPFRQKVTFILLDQSNECKENIIDSFKPDPNSNSFKRPVSDMNIASGVPQFCPLKNLISQEHEYIKDDCMFIKIIIDSRDLIDV